MSHIDRRKLLGTAMAAAVISRPLFGTAARAAPPTLGPFVRRAVSGLVASDLQISGYETAVAQMKALPPSNPLSWTAQAMIHSPGFGVAGPCEHGTWFWVWHRIYLYWFERIVRSMSGFPQWSLPYWDYEWTSAPSPASKRVVPPPMRVTTSALYDSTRSVALNTGGSLSLTATAALSGFTPSSYTAAQGTLNGTPHGAVHNAVGGHMGNFNTAGLDPLFWLHHCEIDRLWNLWLAQGGGRIDPTADPTWKGQNFSFYDENGNQVHMTPCQALNTAAQLGYIYEVEPVEVNQYCPRHPFYPWWWLHNYAQIGLSQSYVLGKGTQTLPFSLSADIGSGLAHIAKNPQNTMILQFAGVEADAEPGAQWEVFVGEHGKYKLNPESPSFVGNVALFGDGVMGEGHHPGEFSFPISRALGKSFDPSALEMTFVASSGVVVDERPVKPKIKSPVSIAEMNILVEQKKKP